MTKLLPAAATAVCLIVLVFLTVTAPGVECRPVPAPQSKKLSSNTMFVFGDDFTDNGNLPLTAPVTEMSRQWSYPYGSSYVNPADGFARPNTPNGRFSNYQIQSDFIARMLGLEEAPPAHALTAEKTCDPSGMTFAHGGAGVYSSTSSSSSSHNKVPTLANQVDTFKNMIKDNTITKQQLDRSVALVAISGNDYMNSVDTILGLSTSNQLTSYIAKVTSEIVSNVERLQKLGVRKVLVNNLHPIGCTPSQSRARNYTSCDPFGNYGATIHNDNLKQKMDDAKKKMNSNSNNAVHIVDLYSAFTKIVNNPPGKGTEMSGQFKRKLSPCCESLDPSGYCGQLDEESDGFLYRLCDKPNKFFYWDDTHPTHAGWEVVMKELEGPIKEFLDR